MSTSSGNEHAKERDSKCKNCKKGFEICQAGIHGRSRGWKLCFVPCGCGKKYYPDKAKSAVPLEPHEYVPGHPGYRPLTPDEDEDTTFDDSEADAGRAGKVISTPRKDRSPPAGSGHTRTDSAESEDPLAWTPRTYEQRTGSVAGLVEDLSNTHIEDPDSSSTSVPRGTEGSNSPRTEDWCDWYWSTEYECHVRCRQNSAVAGGWEYEYHYPEIAKSKESQSRVGDWSDWYWSAEYKCEARHRENTAVTGGWEYEYRSSEGAAASATSSKSSKGQKGQQGPKSGKGKGRAK